MPDRPLPTRRIGARTVSAVGLGCMRMSEPDVSEEAMIGTIRAARDHGVTLFDTAASYGRGGNERLLARALRGDPVALVATKCGIEVAADGALRANGRPEHVRRSCEESLARLGRDRIDLYYLHRVDPNVPIEETMGAMAELLVAGKIAAVGLCEASADTLRRACTVVDVAALQTEWSLWSRQIEPEILPTARELGLAVVAYSPLGRGFFTDAPPRFEDLPEHDYRRRAARLRDDNLRHNAGLRDAIGALAREYDLTLTELALAWLLGQGPDVLAIPGARRVRHLRENLRAATVSLPAEAVARVDEICAAGWAGERYPKGSVLSYDSTRPLS